VYFSAKFLLTRLHDARNLFFFLFFSFSFIFSLILCERCTILLWFCKKTIRFSVTLTADVEAELCPVTFLGQTHFRCCCCCVEKAGLKLVWACCCTALGCGYKVYLVNRCFFQIYSVGGLWYPLTNNPPVYRLVPRCPGLSYPPRLWTPPLCIPSLFFISRYCGDEI